MELQQLIHFQKAAMMNNMSQAAKALHVTQPALSKSIAALEEELGVRLFDRIGKKISLNDTGREILTHVHLIENECEVIRRIGKERQGEKEIRILVKAADQLIPEIVFRIGREHPEIRIRVGHYQSEHEPDILITSSIDPYTKDDGVTVLKEDFVLVVPEGHPLGERKDISLTDLDEQSLIILSEGIPLREIVLHWLRKADVHVTFSYECDTCVMMRELINNGRGVGFVPSRTWSFPYNSRLRILPIRGEGCYRYVNVILNQGHISPQAKLVYQSVTSYLREF